MNILGVLATAGGNPLHGMGRGGGGAESSSLPNEQIATSRVFLPTNKNEMKIWRI
jgi:hypothetical protein